MFTMSDVDKIDRKYFKVLNTSAFTITLQSKNTGHCWHMLNQEYCNKSTVALFHTHVYGSEYHHHANAKNVSQCISIIQKHDRYQIEVRDAKKREALWYHKCYSRSQAHTV